MVPQYVADLIPPIIADTTQYALRNIRDLRNISTRTSISQKSCIPSSVYIWNNLNENLKNVGSFSTFKKSISSMFPLPPVPSYYFGGNRFLSVMHARIRNKCSGLNSDLFHIYLRNSQLCTSSVEPEDAEHHFFRCIPFVIQRLHFLNSIQHLNPLNVNDLLLGKPSLTERENKKKKIFVSVQEYIQQTGRFT